MLVEPCPVLADNSRSVRCMLQLELISVFYRRRCEATTLSYHHSDCCANNAVLCLCVLKKVCFTLKYAITKIARQRQWSSAAPKLILKCLQYVKWRWRLLGPSGSSEMALLDSPVVTSHHWSLTMMLYCTVSEISQLFTVRIVQSFTLMTTVKISLYSVYDFLLLVCQHILDDICRTFRVMAFRTLSHS